MVQHKHISRAVVMVMVILIIAFRPAGAQTNIFPSTGNAGIGTTTPAYPLHLASGETLRIDGGTNASDENNYFSFGGNGTFGIDASGIANGRFVVLNGGNVGIGNPSPAAPLDISGYLHVSGNAHPSTAAQGGYFGWNALTGATGETDFINNQGGGTGGFALFNAPSNGSPLTPLMVIAGNGSVTFSDGSTQTTAWTGALCGGDYAESVSVSGARAS
jgi:hypothetical protein